VDEREKKQKKHFNFSTRNLIPAAPCRHDRGTFFCLIFAYAAFLMFAKLLSVAAWANKYENYSFLLDHLSAISGFLANLTLIFTVFAALRLSLELVRRNFASVTTAFQETQEAEEKISDELSDEINEISGRRAAALIRVCELSIRVLNAVYGTVFAFLLFRFALLSWTRYSPLLFYRHYQKETFEYSLVSLFIVSAGALASFSVSTLFKSQKRLKTVSCAPALHNMFQALGGMSLCAAFAVASVKYAKVDLTLIADCFLVVGCVYCVGGMLRVFVSDMLFGDLTGAFSYGPLLYLPEGFRLFDRNKSWEDRTGLSFKFTWCAGYALRLIPVMVLFGSALVLVSTSLYVVEPYQEALLYRLGKLGADSVKTSGLHFKLPWPIDRVDIYDVSRARNLQIGYAPSDSRDYLWISQHGGEEYSLLLDNGNELIAVNLRVSYTISDLLGYVTRYASPESLLSSKVYEMMMKKTMSSDLNTVLSVDRKRLSDELTADLSEYADELGMGVHVNEVMIANIHPAVDVAEVYQEVVSAAIRKETLIMTAAGDAERAINESLQQSSSAVSAAAARRAEKTALASKDMTVYEGEFFAYGLSPACYRFLKTTDKYQAAIKRGRVYVFAPGTLSEDPDRYLVTNGLSQILVR
jgi:membrane protease subunit HflK